MKSDSEGIWIPRAVCLERDLSWTEKVLYMEIQNLQNLNPDRGCWASNRYFGERLDISPGRIANMISDLRKRGYILQVSFDGKNRSLRTSDKLHENVKDKSNKLHENVSDASRKRDTEPSRKREHKNKSYGMNKTGSKNPEERSRRKRPLTTIPDDFGLTDQMRKWFGENCPGLDIEAETNAFIDRCQAKGTEYTNWPAGWRTQMRNATKWAAERRQQDPRLRTSIPEPTLEQRQAETQNAGRYLIQPPGGDAAAIKPQETESQ